MADLLYNTFKQARLDGAAPDLTDNTIKVMLVTSAYVPSAAHSFRNSITNEVVGAGYTAGGQVLATKTLTGTAPVVFDAADITWATSTITARGAVMYQDTGLATTDKLITFFDFITDQISTAGNFSIIWNVGGIFDLT